MTLCQNDMTVCQWQYVNYYRQNDMSIKILV